MSSAPAGTIKTSPPIAIAPAGNAVTPASTAGAGVSAPDVGVQPARTHAASAIRKGAAAEITALLKFELELHERGGFVRGIRRVAGLEALHKVGLQHGAGIER